MGECGYSAYKIQRLREIVGGLQSNGVDCSKFLTILTQRVSSEQDYYDIFMEGRFALLLVKNGFIDVCLEFCGTGPDIKCSFDSTTLYFEVRRKRPFHNEWNEKGVENASPYPPQNIVSIVDEKLGQLPSNEVNIIAFWSDTIGFEEREVRAAWETIINNPEKYRNLSCMLYTSAGYDMSTLQQCYVYPINSAWKPLSQRLLDKLNSLGELELSVRQKHRDELNAALKKLSEKN